MLMFQMDGSYAIVRYEAALYCIEWSYVWITPLHELYFMQYGVQLSRPILHETQSTYPVVLYLNYTFYTTDYSVP